MRRAAVLGLADTSDADIPFLGEIPRTEADIRTALGRIESPVQRLRDRLFWFHLAPKSLDTKSISRVAETFRDDPRAAAVLDHDKALHALVAATNIGLDDAGIQLWIRAIRAWHLVISNDSYWSLTLALEEHGDFEPAALPSEIDSLRDDAVRLAASGLVAAARDALSRNDGPTVRRILNALHELIETGQWAERAQADIVSPAFETFRELCATIREECETKLVREDNASKHNKSICDEALSRFRAEITELVPVV
jgi:hypothetical protein